MTWRRNAMAGYAAVMALIVVAYYVVPGLRAIMWALLGLGGTAAIVALADVAASHGRALRRERVLRVAGVSLASAVTLEEIADAARRAAATLLGTHGHRPALLAVGELDETAAAWLPMITGPEPRLLPPGEGGAPPLAASAHLPRTEATLLCPLWAAQRPAGDPLAGILAVFGRASTLRALSGTLEILAAQVTLAAERVMLGQEIARRNSEAYFRTLVQDTSDIIMIIEDDGKIRYATPSAASLFGDASVEGTYLSGLLRPAERDDILRSLARMRDRDAGHIREDWQITRPDGACVEVEVRCSDLRQDHTVAGLVLTLRDVTQQRTLEREMKHRAFHDALTGLPNRLLFTDRLAHALARARRAGTTVGVLFVDLDDFKMVNDTMGHAAGDELLRAAANRLSSLVRESDTAARLGGDEFALLLEEASDSAAVERFAEATVRAFGEPFLLTTGQVITTATAGIATTEDSSDASELVHHADLALYAAKAAGKRQWRRYKPVLSVGLAKRRELQAAIGDAVANSDFLLVYQPIAELASGDIVGFEALLRWPHPRWGMIRPDQFITLAEETGDIVPLGSWVLEQAVADLLIWEGDRRRATPLYVSVNVSARQFANPGFVASVERVLASSGLAPSSLLLELTESVLLRRDDRIRSELTELKRIGVRLAIDDFGTGYSSLGYLRELPIDVLKIDKSFVEGIAVSEQRLAIVEVIIRIAGTLGMTVMAEGIESEVQRDLLISRGCRYGQGYLLERPVSMWQAQALAHTGTVMQQRAHSH
jgi:diguanylate cyclase (GGDEF)-like protein/PAS domain S-box-containing protein